jgi:hypothetical protein
MEFGRHSGLKMLTRHFSQLLQTQRKTRKAKPDNNLHSSRHCWTVSIFCTLWKKYGTNVAQAGE